MRFAGDKRKKEEGKREEPASVDLAISLSLAAAPSFFPRASFFPFTFLLLPSASLRDAAHHCVSTITANGIPSRNPRCGTSRLVTAFPQRQPSAASGRIVYEC